VSIVYCLLIVYDDMSRI